MATKPKAPKTKAEKAREILVKHDNGSKKTKDLISMIEKATGMSRAAAQTYFYNARRQLAAAAAAGKPEPDRVTETPETETTAAPGAETTAEAAAA